MFKIKKTRLWTVAIVGALVSPFVFFSSAMKPREANGGSIMVLQEVLYPIEYVWHAMVKVIRTSWENYVDLSHAALENQQLRRKLALMETRIMDYDHQVHEASRLRRLLGFAKRYKRGVSVVEIVGTSGQQPFQTLRITKGSVDGLKVGLPVVSARGVVGRVLRTGFKFADVQLLSDGNFNMDVLVERTRARGVLRGVAAMQCHLQLHRRADIRIGDTLVTSGIADSFPKGLPVGQVVKISYESDNVSQIITIQPWVDYRRLEEVMVLNYTSESVETIIETTGQKWLNVSLQQAGK